MKLRKGLLIGLIVVMLCVTAGAVQAEEGGPQPLEDEFVEILVLAAVNYNLMEGDDELANLSALNEFVAEYYDQRVWDMKHSKFIYADAAYINMQNKKDYLVKLLDEKIKWKKQGSGWIHGFLEIFTDSKELKKRTPPDMIMKVISGSDNPPPDYHAEIKSLVNKNNELQKNMLLDIDTIDAIPDVAPSIYDSSGWSYNVPAISGTASSVTGPDLDVDQPSEFEGVEILLKPVRFGNNGFEPVTVVVESYSPAPGTSAAKSSASTVVSPGSSSSSSLELPLGTYTFCYYWELDQDVNNDGNMDYHHKSTSSVTLDINSSDNPESAISVMLNPDSSVSTPNGKCGETALEQASDLTPEEAANEGTHVYVQTCSGTLLGDPCDQDPPETISVSVQFTSGAVILSDSASGDSHSLPRVGENQYAGLDANGSSFSTITFTADGIVSNLTDDEWATNCTLTHIRQ